MAPRRYSPFLTPTFMKVPRLWGKVSGPSSREHSERAMRAMPREMPKGELGIDPMAEKKDAAPLAYHVFSMSDDESMLEGAGVGGAHVGGAVDVVVDMTVVVVFVSSVVEVVSVVVVVDVVVDDVVEEVVDELVVVDEVKFEEEFASVVVFVWAKT